MLFEGVDAQSHGAGDRPSAQRSARHTMQETARVAMLLEGA
jgi:hypothetical protein